MPVIGAADRDSVIARGRLDPDIVVSRLAHDLAICYAIQRHTPGDTKIFGAGYLAQPNGTLKQDTLSVVLNLPSQILPMLHAGASFPFHRAFRHKWLIEFLCPVGNVQLTIFELDQGFETIGTPIRRKSHHLAAFIPIGENIARHPAIAGAETSHVEEVVAEESAHRMEPNFLERFELRSPESDSNSPIHGLAD